MAGSRKKWPNADETGRQGTVSAQMEYNNNYHQPCISFINEPGLFNESRFV